MLIISWNVRKHKFLALLCSACHYFLIYFWPVIYIRWGTLPFWDGEQGNIAFWANGEQKKKIGGNKETNGKNFRGTREQGYTPHESPKVGQSFYRFFQMHLIALGDPYRGEGVSQWQFEIIKKCKIKLIYLGHFFFPFFYCIWQGARG